LGLSKTIAQVIADTFSHQPDSIFSALPSGVLTVDHAISTHEGTVPAVARALAFCLLLLLGGEISYADEGAWAANFEVEVTRGFTALDGIA
jgi:hypothetical protein